MSATQAETISFESPEFSAGQVLLTHSIVDFPSAPVVFHPTRVTTFSGILALHAAHDCADAGCSNGAHRLPLGFRYQLKELSARIGSDEPTDVYCFPEGPDPCKRYARLVGYDLTGRPVADSGDLLVAGFARPRDLVTELRIADDQGRIASAILFMGKELANPALENPGRAQLDDLSWTRGDTSDPVVSGPPTVLLQTAGLASDVDVAKQPVTALGRWHGRFTVVAEASDESAVTLVAIEGEARVQCQRRDGSLVTARPRIYGEFRPPVLEPAVHRVTVPVDMQALYRQWCGPLWRLRAMDLILAGRALDNQGNEAWTGALTITAEADKVTVLTVNLEGTDEDNFSVPWRVRYARIAAWMLESQTVPDVLLLQEVPGSKCWFLGGCDPMDYESLFGLMRQIRQDTGVQYRVAALSVEAVPFKFSEDGLGTLCQGRAVLYNSNRFANVTPTSGELYPGSGCRPRPAPTTASLLPSLSCANPPDDMRGDCAVVDGRGLHWGIDGAIFNRLALTDQVGRWVDVYSVHLSPTNDSYSQLGESLVPHIENTFPSTSITRLLPPIIGGDFNLGAVHVQDGEIDSPVGNFRFFRIAAWSDVRARNVEGDGSFDLDGFLVGRSDAFASQYGWRTTDARTLPPGARPRPPAEVCRIPEIAWSDHCGLYIEISMP
ncbi:hypothetical protein [Geodermatophilus sp. CPCC 205506]|uniref:hypothetical protein n=1 Tax=Geodermatophilus sp. CPCC 205506 TaxID=2936596 RepID=UPI003EE864F6